MYFGPGFLNPITKWYKYPQASVTASFIIILPIVEIQVSFLFISMKTSLQFTNIILKDIPLTNGTQIFSLKAFSTFYGDRSRSCKSKHHLFMFVYNNRRTNKTKHVSTCALQRINEKSTVAIVKCISAFADFNGHELSKT